MLYSVFNEHHCILERSSDPLFRAGGCLLVGLDGLEPSTSRLSGARSSHLSYRPLISLGGHGSIILGGDDGVRTHDPLLAGQVLSQLSYTPDWVLRNDPQKLNSKIRVCCKYRTSRQWLFALL